MFILALENRELNGVYNAVAPNPVTNRQLVMQLAKKICGRFFLPVYVPAFVLKIMLGEMSIEVLKSATVSARKILQTGFVFSYPEIESAIDDLV
jgi:NAD dependent epimerase/dehydratase family enzyme